MPWIICKKKKRNTISSTDQNRYIVDALYLQFPGLQFTHLLKLICIPQTNARSSFSVTCGHAQQRDENTSPPLHVSCRVWARQRSASCFSSHTMNECSVPVLLGSAFARIFGLVFWLVIPLLKWAPGTVLKCCLVALHMRRLWRALQRKYVC